MSPLPQIGPTDPRPPAEQEQGRVPDDGVRERPNNLFTRSPRGGRVLSALMLPFFAARPPTGFGVLTTIGRRTGKTRRRCVRVVRDGDKAYLVMLGPALIGRPEAVSAWLWNIRANPRVRLRIRGGTFRGIARELEDPEEKHRAREAYCETVTPFDYAECRFHLGGRASRPRIERLHRHWFDTGIPLAIDLDPGRSPSATRSPNERSGGGNRRPRSTG